MNILHVSAGYTPFIGGAQTYLREISERLVRDGHNVTVVTSDIAEVDRVWSPAGRRIDVSRETIGGVQVIRCPVRHLPGAPLSFYLLRRAMSIAAPYMGVSVMSRLGRWVPRIPILATTLRNLQQSFDLIHAVNISFEQPV